MKPLLTAALILSATMSYGQIGAIEQGNVIGGGRLGFNYYSYRQTVLNPPSGFNQQEANGEFDMYMSPLAAYFFMTGLAIGLDIDFGYYGNGNYCYTYYGFGPLLYYFHPLSARTALMAKGEFNYHHNQSYNTLGWAIGPGLAWFLNDYIALTAILLLQNEWYKGAYYDYSTFPPVMYDARYRTLCIGPNVGFKKFFDLSSQAR